MRRPGALAPPPVEQRVLDRHEGIEPRLRDAPAQFRLAPPRARAAARRIHEHGIERAGRRVARMDFDHGSGALRTRAEQRQTPRIDIAGDERAQVFHVGRQRQRLAACAGRQIENAFAGPRAREQRRDLRRFILEFEEAQLEHPVLAQGREAVAGKEANSEWRVARRVCVVAFGAQRGEHLVARSLQHIDAQIDGRAGLRRAHFVEQIVAQRA